jgi:hypothetical protein
MLLNTRENPGAYLAGIGRVDSSDLRKAAARYIGRSESAAVSVMPRPEKKK